jgi:hypothetical protein
MIFPLNHEVFTVQACLPSPQYQFSAPIIGGYGRYRRVPCEVNDLGPNVYRVGFPLLPYKTFKLKTMQRLKLKKKFNFYLCF